VATLADLDPGDHVKLRYAGDAGSGLTAVLIYDFGTATPPESPSQPAPAPAPAPTPSPTTPSGPTIIQSSGSATGPVVHVYPADGALSMYDPSLGKLLYVATPSRATLTAGSAPTTLGAIAVGDRVAVSWSSIYSTGVVIASSLDDSGPATDK
jgi:hypothetical protein